MNGNDLFNLVYNETTGEFESYADQGCSKAKEFFELETGFDDDDDNINYEHLSAEEISKLISPPKEGLELLGKLFHYQHAYGLLMNSRNVNQKLQELEYEAEQEMVESQALLAYYYEENGDLYEARKWYTRAFNNGDRFAEFRLENMS